MRWISNLLRIPLAATRDGVQPPAVHADGSSVVGLDVGTGATCIYPLVGRALFGWRAIATEMDPHSAAFARELVTRNDYADSIHVVEVTAEALLEGAVARAEQMGVLAPQQPIAFTMCNPPFFAAGEEVRAVGAAHRGRRGKGPLP